MSRMTLRVRPPAAPPRPAAPPSADEFIIMDQAALDTCLEDALTSDAWIQQRVRKSMPFAHLANVLDMCTTASRPQQQELIRQLFDSISPATCDNPPLEHLALFRILMPTVDNKSVYGLKSTRLIRAFKAALETCRSTAKITAKTRLENWLKEPVAVEGLRPGTVVSLPEVVISHAYGMCVQHTQGVLGLTVLDVAEFCQSLTNAFTHISLLNQQPANTKDTLAQALMLILPRLHDTLQCRTFVRMLLRTVPMGVGPQTVLSAVSPWASTFLSKQRDLSRLAEWVNTPDTALIALKYGVPFTPMTCYPVSSPAIVRWLFSKEDKAGEPIPPKNGRLIMLSNGAWCVPVDASKAGKIHFVDIESPLATQKAYRRKHVEWLRQFRRGGILDAEAARGLIVHYFMCSDKYTVTMMLRSVTEAASAGISFVDEAHNALEYATGEEDPKTVLNLIARTADPVIWTSPQQRITIQARSVFDDDDKRGKADTSKGVLVQTKLDGDRCQVHIFPDPQTKKTTVLMFTKNGKPVHTLYSDVANEIASLHPDPCILDGEIIVVSNKDNSHLPWCDSKWRYNTSTVTPIASITSATDENSVIGIVYDRSTLNGTDASHGDFSDTNVDISFATYGGFKKYLSESEKATLHGRVLKDARVQFVAYDILMLRNTDLSSRPCKVRFEQLKALQWLKNASGKGHHVSALTSDNDARFAKDANEVHARLLHSMQRQTEGIIIKDPRAPYVFGKTTLMRKLKIRGPDINTGVVGCGFSLAKNPRMWGLLTAILKAKNESPPVFWAYTRVEVLEGDMPGRAMRHICDELHSTVSVAALRASKNGPVLTKKYSVMQIDSKTVRWDPRGEDDASLQPCILHFPHGFEKDIHWLCNPFECAFGLSVHGDLRPLVHDSLPSEADENLAVAAGQRLKTPRFPVGRIEFNDHQRSKCDTPVEIDAKFKAAAADDENLRAFLSRRILGLRSPPPRKDRLEEVRRIVEGLEGMQLPWPVQPSGTYKVDEMSRLLTKYGFDALTHMERQVILGLKAPSQWTACDVAKKMEGIQTVVNKSDMEADLPELSKRLKALRNIRQPLARAYQTPLARAATAFTSHLSSVVMSFPECTYEVVESVMSEGSEMDECDDINEWE